MTFYGQAPQAEQPKPLKAFAYKGAEDGISHIVEARDIYFYESGHIGFWIDLPNDDRRLIRAVKTSRVDELPPDAKPPYTAYKEQHDG